MFDQNAEARWAFKPDSVWDLNLSTSFIKFVWSRGLVRMMECSGRLCSGFTTFVAGPLAVTDPFGDIDARGYDVTISSVKCVLTTHSGS